MTLTPERIKELCDRHLRVVGAGYVRPQDALGLKGGQHGTDN